MVEVDGFLYEAVPVTTDHMPRCAHCAAPYQGSWRFGQAVHLDDPRLCGQPKKNGLPCQWDITREPCRAHLSPQEREHQRAREAAEAERRKEEEQRRQRANAERRENLIEILSVACPHCDSAAAALCRRPKGVPVRPLHQARRALAGILWPKEFVLEEYSFPSGRKAPDPPLDGDPREILDHPLPDKTAQAEPRYAREQQEAAEGKLRRARRELWLASAPRKDAVSAQMCPACGAAPHTPCTPHGRGRGWQPHTERVDAAMKADTTDTDLAEEQRAQPQ